MGVQTGTGAVMARHIFTSLNKAFSRREVRTTRQEFEVFLKDRLRHRDEDPPRDSPASDGTATRAAFDAWLAGRIAEEQRQPSAPLTREELGRAVFEGLFYRFAEHKAWVHDADWTGSRQRLREDFELGAYDLIGHAVISNLFAWFSSPALTPGGDVVPEAVSTFDEREETRRHDVALPLELRHFLPEIADFRAGLEPVIHDLQEYLALFYPRPMVFERQFGDREEVVVRSNDYGIKIVVCTLRDPMRIVKRRFARLLAAKENEHLDPAERAVVERYVAQYAERLKRQHRAAEADAMAVIDAMAPREGPDE